MVATKTNFYIHLYVTSICKLQTFENRWKQDELQCDHTAVCS